MSSKCTMANTTAIWQEAEQTYLFSLCRESDFLLSPSFSDLLCWRSSRSKYNTLTSNYLLFFPTYTLIKSYDNALKVKLGMSDVPPVWNLRTVFWFPFPVSSLVFFCLVLLPFLSCHFSANGPFSWFFSPQKLLKHFSFRVGLFSMALVEQLGDDSWYVQLAAMWHWYLPLCNYKNIKRYINCFCPFVFFNFSLIWYC